jgi:electron transfer flavoprotein beta subunit
MTIVVCIKQVPDSAKIEVDETTGALRREGVDTKINPFDLYAIESVLRIREQVGGQIVAISMGPAQATQVLREAFTMGVDRGVLLSDPKFAGSDTLATAFTLARGIQKAAGDFRVIVCGKQTTDGDTAQVGPEIAEFLQIPHVCSVGALAAISPASMILTVDLLDVIQTIEVKYPCLITVEKDIFPHRLPSFRKKQETRARAIEVLNCDDLGMKGDDRFGLDGSPTHVEKIFPPKTEKVREMWNGSSLELVERMMKQLQRSKFLVSDGR